MECKGRGENDSNEEQEAPLNEQNEEDKTRAPMKKRRTSTITTTVTKKEEEIHTDATQQKELPHKLSASERQNSFEDCSLELLDLMLEYMPPKYLPVLARVNKHLFNRVSAEKRRKLNVSLMHDSTEMFLWALKNGSPMGVQGQTRKLLMAAARRGDLALLQKLRSMVSPSCWDESMSQAIGWTASQHGHLHVLKWAHEQGIPLDWGVCAHAPNVHVLKWARENGLSWHRGLWMPIARPNNKYEKNREVWEMHKWAFMNGYPADGLAMCKQAILREDREFLEWAARNDREKSFFNERVCAAAAAEGQLQLLQWLREKTGCPWDESTCISLASLGNLEALQWVRENGCPWNKQVCEEAAKHNLLHVLKWAHKNGCPWDENTSVIAARHGHFELLKWAHENGCPCNKMVCEVAAANNNLEMLQWAREQGCPWDSRTCVEAAKYGNLQVLQWAHEHGCPWDECTLYAAASNGHLDVVKWAKTEGCPCNEKTCVYAARGDSVEVMEWLHENGCPWNRRAYNEAQSSEMLEYLEENGCPGAAVEVEEDEDNDDGDDIYDEDL
ncbi:Ankyrin repeat domain-containing protein 60 [Balamuthia mandrillaris]